MFIVNCTEDLEIKKKNNFKEKPTRLEFAKNSNPFSESLYRITKSLEVIGNVYFIRLCSSCARQCCKTMRENICFQSAP